MNTTAMYVPTPTPTPSNYTTPTFAPFFESLFGVKILSGADHIGAYSVNPNPNYVYPRSSVTPTPTPTPTETPTATPTPTGSVSGRITLLKTNIGVPFIYVYLSTGDGYPISTYFTTTDKKGNYEIDNVPYGQYTGYIALLKSSMNHGKPDNNGRSITIDSDTPDVVASGSISVPK